ncbi:AAA family ATPase [Mangrovibacterium sp.]|uniref:AAA family ATPase n=1 Tax=Mangrovibacterium sp. TaxID=1961364 RepID=UPI0035674812
MKKVRITSLSLRNFKGIKAFDASFDSNQTRIYGDNATGKTTLVDAFTWLLFGKNSADDKQFSIKPFDGNNQVIHKLDSEVSATFDVDGEAVTLKRVFREKWVTKRGSSDPELSGHETVFFWNDVPMKAGEFQRKVDDIILEDTFKMITSPFYFNNLKWQERRNILTSIVGDVNDDEIAETRLDFKALFSAKGNKSIDELKKEVSAKKKKLKDELKLIPARVDEVTRSIPDAKDWANIENEIEIVSKNISIVDEQLQDRSKVSESYFKAKEERQRKLNQLKSKISDIEFAGSRELQKQLNEKTDAIAAAKHELKRIDQRVKEDAEEIKRLEARINQYATEQEQLRNEWNRVNERQMEPFSPGAFKCPTCNQPLPESDIEAKKAEMQRNFNDSKQKRLSEIQKQGTAITPIIEQLGEKIKAIEANDYTEQIKRHEAAIAKWESRKLKSVQAILADNAEYQGLKEQLKALEAEPEVKMPELDDDSSLKAKKRELSETLDRLKKDLGLKEQIAKGEARKAELLKQEKQYSAELAELEQTEFTIDEFTRAKVDALEGRINALFGGKVSFRMFDTQLNGGLIECCDTIIDGVPWNDANNAAKINAGIAIINVLTDHFQQMSPIWIDNAESITSIADTNAQRIELYVSEKYKTLEVAS